MASDTLVASADHPDSRKGILITLYLIHLESLPVSGRKGRRSIRTYSRKYLVKAVVGRVKRRSI